ncbi:hypothetical protein CRG98_018729 [Punica granatum]|uniref:Reverse transcriptase domain-containing protein n=1 Tax=Punica granatum TaxID=22663 RepID=A0A2I0JZI4_PUNGR|nr:hypothetical protein CRG98_018729 [Punica granatum]
MASGDSFSRASVARPREGGHSQAALHRHAHSCPDEIKFGCAQLGDSTGDHLEGSGSFPIVWLSDWTLLRAMTPTTASYQRDACHGFFLLVFGTLLFPHSPNLIDGAIAQVVLQAVGGHSYVEALLAETVRSLDYVREVRRGRMRGSPHLLQTWLLAHVRPFCSSHSFSYISDERSLIEHLAPEEVVKQINAGFLEVCNYSEWVANIVPVEKKDGKVRVCVDYPDLNKASPKDNFPLPHIDVLVDNTARHAQFSFMDGFSGYNQIRMAEKDKLKTTFTTMWGTFCYRVMPFGLKNAGATYQRAMVTLFHDMMHKEVEVYVDDMIAKSKEGEDHLVNLKRLFDRLKEYKLRLNPGKCTFGARAIYYLSKKFTEGESNYPEIEKMCCALVWVMQRLRQYTLYHTIRLLSKADPLRYLLDSPSSMRNIAKWRCQLTEYDIEYVPRTSVKGQAIADHLAEFSIDDDTPINTC